MWTFAVPQLLLASDSPRRLELLRQQMIPVEKLSLPKQAEDEPRNPGESVIDYVTRTSADKNRRAQQLIRHEMPFLADLPILSGDTTVALGQTILGKPENDQHAAQILRQLSGRTHDVFSAVTLHWNGLTKTTLSHTLVTFEPLTEMEIQAYIASGDHLGKAGAYGIQGFAAGWVKRLEGSYSGVVGLPLHETICLLKEFKLLLPKV